MHLKSEKFNILFDIVSKYLDTHDFISLTDVIYGTCDIDVEYSDLVCMVDLMLASAPTRPYSDDDAYDCDYEEEYCGILISVYCGMGSSIALYRKIKDENLTTKEIV